MNKLIAALILIVVLIAIYLGVNQQFQLEQKPEENVLWKISQAPPENRRASITRVVLIKESCNQLQFKVNYQSNGVEKGFLRFNMGVKPSNQAFRSDHSVTLNFGNGTSDYDIWMTNEIVVAETESIRISIEEIVDKAFQATEHFVEIPYPKTWRHNCE